MIYTASIVSIFVFAIVLYLLCSSVLDIASISSDLNVDMEKIGYLESWSPALITKFSDVGCSGNSSVTISTLSSRYFRCMSEILINSSATRYLQLSSLLLDEARSSIEVSILLNGENEALTRALLEKALGLLEDFAKKDFFNVDVNIQYATRNSSSSSNPEQTYSAASDVYIVFDNVSPDHQFDWEYCHNHTSLVYCLQPPFLRVYAMESPTQIIHPSYVQMLLLSHVLDIQQAKKMQEFVGDLVLPIHVVQELTEYFLVLSAIHTLHSHLQRPLEENIMLSALLASILDSSFVEKVRIIKSQVILLRNDVETISELRPITGSFCGLNGSSVTECPHVLAHSGSLGALKRIGRTLRSLDTFYSSLISFPAIMYTNTVLALSKYLQNHGHHDFICYAPYIIPLLVPISRLMLAW